MTPSLSFWDRITPTPDEHGQPERRGGSHSAGQLIFIHHKSDESDYGSPSHESWSTKAERNARHSEAIAVVDVRLKKLAEEGASAKARLRAFVVAEGILGQDAIPPYVSWDAEEEE